MSLPKYDWCEIGNAKKTRDLTRNLFENYLQVLEASGRMAYPCGWVWPGPLSISRDIFVVRSFVKDQVVKYIEVNLKSLDVLKVRQAITAYLPKDGDPEKELIVGYLKDAVSYLTLLEGMITKHKDSSRKILKSVFSIIKNISPAALFTAWAVHLNVLSSLPLPLSLSICAAWIGAYYLFIVIAVPFHDSDYRRHLLFEGYMGTPGDGIKPLSPPLSRYEEALYTHLGVPRPIVISWDLLVAFLNYFLLICFVVATLYYLPLMGKAKTVVGGLGFLFILQQTNHLYWLFRLIKIRYPNRSFWHIGWCAVLE